MLKEHNLNPVQVPNTNLSGYVISNDITFNPLGCQCRSRQSESILTSGKAQRPVYESVVSRWLGGRGDGMLGTKLTKTFTV